MSEPNEQTKAKLSKAQIAAMVELGGGEFWQTFSEMQIEKVVLDSLISAGLAECLGEQYRLTGEGVERRYNIVYLESLEEEQNDAEQADE